MTKTGANYKLSSIWDIRRQSALTWRGPPLLHSRVGYVVEDVQTENQPKMYIVL
jgi:hypothetical protein